MTEDQARKQAKEEAEFYSHLATFAVVCAGLAALNVLTSPGYPWVLWVVFGWGIGVASHAVGVFGNRLGRGWVERRTADLMGAEASEARLRSLLDETLDARALPAGAPQDLARLQRRIEHLEAIVTAPDADPFRFDPDPIEGRAPLTTPLLDEFGHDDEPPVGEAPEPPARRRVR